MQAAADSWRLCSMLRNRYFFFFTGYDSHVLAAYALSCSLLQVRAEFRSILLEMGFSEMPTNRFVERLGRQLKQARRGCLVRAIRGTSYMIYPAACTSCRLLFVFPQLLLELRRSVPASVAPQP